MRMARAGSAARLLILALSVGLVAAGVAQSAGSPIPRLQTARNLPTAPRGPIARKVDLRLLDLAHGSRAARRQLPTLALAPGNRVRVELRFAGSPRDIAEKVSAVGGVVEGRNGSFVQALVPVSSLTDLARTAGVRTINPPRPFIPALVPGQGIASSGATAWHAAGATGAGVKVAIIDFGFGGYRQRQAEGELPGRLNTLGNYCDPGEYNDPANDHGTAVAEIVHETAPGAELFLICADTIDGLENAKDYAISRGVRVIHMSGSFVGYSRGDGTGGPGTPDEIIADARTRGVLWVNAAGNWGDGHWSGLYDDPDHDLLLNFTSTDNGNAIRLAAGETTCALLKWDEWPVTDEDYDFFLVRQTDKIDVERSMNVQDGTQPPVEFLCYTNPGPAGWYWYVIRRNGGGTPVRLDLFTTQTLTYQVPDGSIDEQAASPSAFAVG